MDVVPMARSHLEALARLEALCFSAPWSRQALAEELTNPAAVFLVAEEGGVPLGYAGMHCVLDECYLDNVAVFPQARRRGVAGALLAALEERARARGGSFLSLEVRPSNTGAVALYRGAGFEEAGRRRDFYRAPREDALILTKRLTLC